MGHSSVRTCCTPSLVRKAVRSAEDIRCHGETLMWTVVWSVLEEWAAVPHPSSLQFTGPARKKVHPNFLACSTPQGALSAQLGTKRAPVGTLLWCSAVSTLSHCCLACVSFWGSPNWFLSLRIWQTLRAMCQLSVVSISIPLWLLLYCVCVTIVQLIALSNDGVLTPYSLME